MKIRNLAVIPARGGSKRIPRKNIKEFCGKPIIAYSIEAAINSNIFDEVIVSTDDVEIANVAKNFGARVPFYRASETSNDFAGITDVLLEVLEKYTEQKVYFDNICLIYATAPFVNAEKVVEAYKILTNNEYNAVLPVIKYSYPIQRALRINGNDLKMINDSYIKSRSQDLEPSYHDSGQFFWIKSEIIQSQKKVFVDKLGAVIINEKDAQDIDTIEDWEIAEFKYRYFLKRNK